MAKTVRTKKKEVIQTFPVKKTFWRKGIEYKGGKSNIELSNPKTIAYFQLKKYI